MVGCTRVVLLKGEESCGVTASCMIHTHHSFLKHRTGAERPIALFDHVAGIRIEVHWG